MFPEINVADNDVFEHFILDDNDFFLRREYQEDLESAGIMNLIDRLDRTLNVIAEQVNQEPIIEEPIIEDSIIEEPIIEEPIIEEPIIEEPIIEDSIIEEPESEQTVVEEQEQKKVDTSEIKLQKLLANVLKNKKHKRGNYTHDKESINNSGTLYEG